MSARRICGRCGIAKPESDFAFRDRAAGKRQSYCRDCSNLAWKEWYGNERNRIRHRATLYERRKRRIERKRELVRALKSEPCTDCGGRFPPYVMDFDHVLSKAAEIPVLVRSSSQARLVEEIQKCEVVCANCHRERTHRRTHGGLRPDEGRH